MSLPSILGSSPPESFHNYYGVPRLASLDLDDPITQEEVDEDIEDEQIRIDEAFHLMKEAVKKESEGALALKTISDYARHALFFQCFLIFSHSTW
jgi:hypothetical protein